MSRNNYVELGIKGGSLLTVFVLLGTAMFLAFKLDGVHSRILDRQKDLGALTSRTNKLLWEVESAIHLKEFEKRQEAQAAEEFKELANRVREDSSISLADTQAVDDFPDSADEGKGD